MPLLPTDWHRRFTQQATWTASLRAYLLSNLSPYPRRILEVGCGTGSILSSFPISAGIFLAGMDINTAFLSLARHNAPFARLNCSNVYSLPFPPGAFDLTFCHFLLLWLKNPMQALIEMRRVTCSKGFIAAFAEPDYGGRIDFPDELSTIASRQQQALQSQGADPLMGRRLAYYFHQLGLEEIQVGVIGAQWFYPLPTEDLEYQVLYEDLNSLISSIEWEEYNRAEKAARASGSRILYIPTFYALGRLP